MPLLPGSSRLAHSRAGTVRPKFMEAGLLLVILVIGVVLTLASDPVTVAGRTANNFLRLDNLIPNVATTMSWMAIMALGATLVIISGGIDISVGSIFGLSALGTAAVLQQLPSDASAWQSIPIAAIVAMGIGLLCGAINGALIVGRSLCAPGRPTQQSPRPT